MFGQFREILLTRYIGAMLVALFLWQAVIEFVFILLRTGAWLVNRHRSESVLGFSNTLYPWDALIYSAISVLLYWALAYMLVRWLYIPATNASNIHAETRSEEEAQP